MTWYSLALFALFAYGIQNFLYKVSAEKKCNTAWVMVAFSATAGILGVLFFVLLGESVQNFTFLVWIALLGTATFLGALITRTEALKSISSSVAFPITRLYVVLVVLFSFVYFQETLSLFQVIGVSLALVVLLLLTRYSHEERTRHANFRAGVLLATASLFLGAGASIVSKFVAISQESLFAFIGVSGAFGVAFAFGLKNKLQTERENTNHRNAIIIGVLAGLFNFIGYYAMLSALSVGPLSVIAAVHSMNFVIAILLAVLVYKEELTRRRMVGVGLTILALILLRIS